MRESYRDKRNRQARIAREKEEYMDRRKEQRRKEDRRQKERRVGERRMSERRETPRSGFDRRIGERRNDYDRRFVERRNPEDRRSEENENSYEDIVAGRNAVLELLKSEKDINKLFIERGERHGSINKIISMAKERKIIITEISINPNTNFIYFFIALGGIKK